MHPRVRTSKKKLTPQQKNPKQKQPLNHLQLTQSINPSKVEGLFSIDNLVSDQSKKRNKYFSFCIDKTSSLKTIIFLTFHTVQNKQEGVACQTFFLLFPTKVPFQPKSISLTKPDMIQLTPKRKKSNSQSTLVLLQWRRR